MPPRQAWSPPYPLWEAPPLMFPNSTPPGQNPPSPYTVNHHSLPVPAPHLVSPRSSRKHVHNLLFGLRLQLQPPPAPRLRNIPLPDAAVDVFPINLTNDVDFDLLAGRIQNCSIPPHTTIDILPASRECILLQMTTGDRPTSTFAVIRRLQAIIRAPLSLQLFTTELPLAARQSVRGYFLSCSGQDGAGLWQGFLNGARHPQGPRGAVLLRGHCFMWGFSQDYQGQWAVHVDAPFIPGL
ncbi:hypothetical protein FB451DRAFT_1570977 [Mycena latifolia]|nr:hypothetical protein FB451DRAFT_1570977 [Mycena latifolia]